MSHMFGDRNREILGNPSKKNYQGFLNSIAAKPRFYWKIFFFIAEFGVDFDFFARDPGLFPISTQTRTLLLRMS